MLGKFFRVCHCLPSPQKLLMLCPITFAMVFFSAKEKAATFYILFLLFPPPSSYASFQYTHRIHASTTPDSQFRLIATMRMFTFLSSVIVGAICTIGFYQASNSPQQHRCVSGQCHAIISEAQARPCTKGKLRVRTSPTNSPADRHSLQGSTAKNTSAWSWSTFGHA